MEISQPERIISALREAEVGLVNGKTVALVGRELGISEQTYYRWKRKYGGVGATRSTPGNPVPLPPMPFSL